MKKVILSAIVALSAMAADAQVWAGGSLGFSVTDYDNAETETAFKIAPEIGYSLNDKWDIAVALGFNYASNYTGLDDIDYHAFTVEPYARYTFATTGIASFFVEAGGGFGTSKVSHHDSKNVWYVGVRPGVKIALSDKVALVSKLGFLGYKDREDDYSKFDFGVDNNDLSLGLYFNF